LNKHKLDKTAFLGFPLGGNFPPTKKKWFHWNLILSPCDEGIDGEDINAPESRDSRRPEKNTSSPKVSHLEKWMFLKTLEKPTEEPGHPNFSLMVRKKRITFLAEMYRDLRLIFLF